jgi:aryl-alcohol dehydrogenase-like predicted oxidoreductase
VTVRRFGTTDLMVSEVGVGCSRIGGVFSAGSSRRDELDLLREAIDSGINFLDTADLYSQGQSEILVGKAIKGWRDRVVVATKGGYVVPSSSQLLSRAKPLLRPVVRTLRIKKPGAAGPGPAPAMAQDFSPQHLRGAVEASLRRLGTDYIDIYQLHSPPRAVVEVGEFVPALEELRAQGKIRHFGIGADDADAAEPFERHPALRSVQVPFSAIDQAAATRVFPAAARTGVGIVSRSCFAAGFLVGGLSEEELRQRTSDWKAIVDFRATAAALGRPLKQLALKFNVGVEPIAVTVVGMRTPSHLREVLHDLAAPDLTYDEMAALLRH